MEVTIEGGPHAGHYAVDLTNGSCTTGDSQSLIVNASFFEPQGAETGDLDRVAILIEDRNDALTPTERFTAAFYFSRNGVDEGVLWLRPGLGVNALTLDSDGFSTASIALHGTAETGESVEATIECHEFVDKTL